MFKTKRIIKNIDEIKEFDDKVYFCSKEGQLEVNSTIFSKVEPKSFFIKNEFLLYYDLKGNLYIINLNSGRVKKLRNRTYIKNTLDNNRILLTDELSLIGDNWEWKIILYDLKTHEIIFELPKLKNTSPLFLFENQIIGQRKDGNIYHYSIVEDKFLWDLNISKNIAEKIYRQIDPLNNILWMVTDLGNIIGLNTENGKIVHNFGKPDSYPKNFDLLLEKPFFWTKTTVQLDKESNRLIGGMGNLFFEIDILNSNYRLRKLPETAPNIDCRFLPSFTEEFFIYADSDEGIIAVLDRKSLKLLWQRHFFTKGAGYIYNLIYTNKKLYVLYQKNIDTSESENFLEILELAF